MNAHFKKFSTIGLLAATALSLFAGNADAYQADTCDGEIHHGIRSSVTFHINRFSFLKGSQADKDVIYGIDEWNRVRGMSNRFKWVDGAPYTSVVLGDDNWEIAYSYDTDGAVAITWPKGCPCIWPYTSSLCMDGDLTEADILVNPEMIATGSPPDNLVEAPPGEANSYLKESIMHELGHVLGMKHEDRYQFMTLMGVHYDRLTGKRYGSRRGIYAGSHPFEPQPDDIEFGRRFHGDGNTGWDWAASGWHRTFDGETRNTMSAYTKNVCVGDTYTIKWALANRSTQGNSASNPLKVRYMLSEDKIITADDIVVGESPIYDLAVNGYYVFDTTLTVPSGVAPMGTYYTGVLLDPDDEFGEYIEDNNGTYLPLQIHINAPDLAWCGIPTVTSPINTVTHHTVNTRMRFVAPDKQITSWSPTHLVFQIQPTDGIPLSGKVTVDGIEYPLSGWYTDVKVPYHSNTIAMIETTMSRRIRIEWWAIDMGNGTTPPIPGDPYCEEEDCIPIAGMNKDVDIPLSNSAEKVRISPIPGWNFNTIVVSLHPISGSGMLATGTIIGPRGPVAIPNSGNAYYTEVHFPYDGQKGYIDFGLSTPAVNSGYKMRWWAQTE